MAQRPFLWAHLSHPFMPVAETSACGRIKRKAKVQIKNEHPRNKSWRCRLKPHDGPELALRSFPVPPVGVFRFEGGASHGGSLAGSRSLAGWRVPLPCPSNTPRPCGSFSSLATVLVSGQNHFSVELNGLDIHNVFDVFLIGNVLVSFHCNFRRIALEQ